MCRDDGGAKLLRALLAKIDLPSLGVINALAQIAADFQQVEEHADGIVQHIDFAAGVIVPGDADFADGVVAMPGDCQ